MTEGNGNDTRLFLSIQAFSAYKTDANHTSFGSHKLNNLLVNSLPNWYTLMNISQWPREKSGKLSGGGEGCGSNFEVYI